MSLTSHFFFPKLNPTTGMRENRTKIFLSLLLAFLFLFAQFHLCEETSFNASTSHPFSSHLCPACSTLSSAITSYCPVLAPVSVLRGILRLDAASTPLFNSVRRVSPRAPPAL